MKTGSSVSLMVSWGPSSLPKSLAKQIQRCHIILLIHAKYMKYTSEPKFKFKFLKNIL